VVAGLAEQLAVGQAVERLVAGLAEQQVVGRLVERLAERVRMKLPRQLARSKSFVAC